MSEKIYGWLLKLYPIRFRDDYGASAMQLFRDRLRAERGVFKRFRFWLDVVTDLAVSIPREHWRQIPPEPDPVGHRLSEEAVAAMSKRSAVAPAVFVSIITALGFTTAWFGNGQPILLVAAYFPLAIRAITRFRFIRVFEKQWRSYQLILESDRLQQKQHGRALTMFKSDIVKINEDQHGLMVISLSETRPSAIQIPVGLIGYQRVREHVSQWMPISQRQSLWLSDPRPVRSCIWSLLPALMLVRSVHWFLVVVVAYCGLVLLEVIMNIARPPRDSGLASPRRRLELPAPAYMWRRFTRQCRQPSMLVLIALPVVRAVLAIPG
jgi:hypothetical protein